MKKNYLAIGFMLLSCITAFAQDTTVSVLAKGEEQIFEKVDEEASYPGGPQAWIQYLMKNLNASVPSDSGASPGNYRVIVKFIVAKDGTVSDIEALTSHGYGMEAEVIRLIKASAKWSPAKVNDHYVNAYRQQPVTFRVADEGKKKRRKKS